MQSHVVRVSIPIISIGAHGGTRVLIEFANHLAAAGHEVFVLVSRGRMSTPFRFHRLVKVKPVGVRTGLKYLDYSVYLLLLAFSFPRRSLVLATFFVTYLPVRLFNLMGGGPYAYFVQDIEAKYAGIAGSILNAACRLTYGDRRIIAANSYLRERLRVDFGVHCNQVNVGPAPAFYELPARAPRQYDVIYFLRREAWKGRDRFLRFLELAQGRLRCLCVSQDERLFAELAGTGVMCRKPGDDAELIDCIDSARVLLFTSYAEGFALPPLEVMARGLPVVLFRCGGPDVYVHDGANAIYVDSEAQALEAVTRLLGDQGVYARMSAQARATAARHRLSDALQALTDQLSSLYDRSEGASRSSRRQA
jgi:glycosyltransferase involved in cell wall biosynthesis